MGQFAEACAEIRVAAPTMGGLDAMPAHLAGWWGRLVSPPGLGEYHSAIMDLHRGRQSPYRALLGAGREGGD